LKALRFAKTGDLKYLELAQCPKPHPAAGEVLVQLKAAGLNQSDISNVLGKHPYTTLPRTPGRDFAGVVIEGPQGLLGKAVWGTGNQFGFTRDGSHAEYLTAPAQAVALKPESLSFVQAASCGVPYTTAWSALERCSVKEGTRLLVIGAAGAVGSAALALARARGAEVVGAVRRGEQADSLKTRGFDAIVLSGEKTLAEAAKAHFANGAEVVFDTTGAWLPESISATAQYGRIAVIVAPADGRVTLPMRDLYRRGASIVGINTMLLTGEQCALTLAEMGKAFNAGKLAAPASPQERPLDSGTEIYVEQSRARRGKIVFVMT